MVLNGRSSLVNEFSNLEFVKRYKELKKILNTDEYKKKIDAAKLAKRKNDNEMLEEIYKTPFIEEYLDLQDEVNNTLKMIKNIIEGELEI